MVVAAERAWDGARLRRSRSRRPEHFRIEAYIGHGGTGGVVVRGRVLDNPLASEAEDGEGVGAAVRRSLGHFMTNDLPGVPLTVTVGGVSVEAVTDTDGYFLVRVPTSPGDLQSPWTRGTVELRESYRGVAGPHTTPVEVRVPSAQARFGVVSDVDDTILQTGVQRIGKMVLQTLTGSSLTRTPFPGAVELYRDLAAGTNPVFYVSSSPWNLHDFLVGFLRHRGFPLGPVLLRDLLGTWAGREQKHDRIREVLELHPDLSFVLLGDSGEHDPQIYADIVREHPGRILAVYIREVRLDPGDGRVEQVSDAWGPDVPFVLAADSDAVRLHAQGLGLL
ncbi:phosphatase [Nocardioides flavus (ex Wang et al. 2016)]|uniref:Phosphatase n=1 Tax=Nocardioides flavus (ex Wang et al. 2016) TaxID=2058780 RepID=A0ABQ3HMI5_9ACTN|nr:phosphatase [Nocardioides flavus (ex Wang et al. 2016)]